MFVSTLISYVPVSQCLHELLCGDFATVFECTGTCTLVFLCLSVSMYAYVPCKVTKKILLPQVEMNYSFVAMVTGVNRKLMRNKY